MRRARGRIHAGGHRPVSLLGRRSGPRAIAVWLTALLLSAASATAQPDPTVARLAVLGPPVAALPAEGLSPPADQPPVPAPSPDPSPPPRAPDPPAPGVGFGLPKALRATVDALGASSGVPDGVGVAWYPSVPVRGQSAHMGLVNYQAGVTVPVSTTDTGGWYANGAGRLLSVPTNAALPTDKGKFSAQFWDVQAGGAYLRELDSGWSWGVTLNVGSASDRPFNSLREATFSALAFVRKPDGERNGWLFFVVSTTNGQIGHNIPIPGVAYESVTERLHAVVGFPFLTIDYRPTQATQFEFTYAAITDVLARASYHLTDHARLFTEYEWTNQAWFRADRLRSQDQTFLYQMHVGSGFGWVVAGVLDLRVTGGYAFDRFFVDNAGLGFQGRNRVVLAPGPFLAAQLEFKF